jgi:hypothetical protein
MTKITKLPATAIRIPAPAAEPKRINRQTRYVRQALRNGELNLYMRNDGSATAFITLPIAATLRLLATPRRDGVMYLSIDAGRAEITYDAPMPSVLRLLGRELVVQSRPEDAS